METETPVVETEVTLEVAVETAVEEAVESAGRDQEVGLEAEAPLETPA